MRFLMAGVTAVSMGCTGAEAQQDRSRPPEPNGDQGSWFPQDAYPEAARVKGEEGRVGVSMVVDATGRPSACIVGVSSGSTALDAATCELAMRNARFTPALDEKGRPTVAQYALKNVVWMLDVPRFDVGNGPATIPLPTYVVAIDVEGRATACHVEMSNGGRAECPTGMVGAKLGPIATRGGVAIPGVLTQRNVATIEAPPPAKP